MILHSHFIVNSKFSIRRSFEAHPILNILKSSITTLLLHTDNGEDINAHKMFDKMQEPNLKSWNAKIRECCLNNHYKEALSLYRQMQQAGLRPDDYGLPALLKSCAALSTIELGRALHGSVVKEGYESDKSITKALMNLYAKCGALYDSQQLIDEMGMRDPVLWNILMSGFSASKFYLEVTELFYSMHVCEEEPKPNSISIAIVLPVCAQLRALKSGKSIHGYVIKSGLESETLVGNALLSMYAKCGSVWEDSYCLFSQIDTKDVISWNAMIAGYIENGLFLEAFRLFCQMLLAGVGPNCATIATILPVCAFLADWYHGKEIHCYVLRFGLETDVSVCNALMTFYSRIGYMKEAEFIFRNMNSRDLVSWNTVIVGYAMNGLLSNALELFHELLSTGLKPDSITLISLLPVCAQLHNLQEGKKIHEYVLGNFRLCKDTAVGNALVSFYAKCGKLEDASRTFEMIRKRDLISWNTMIAAYAESGQGGKLVESLCDMNNQGIRPDSVTILNVLRVCSFFGVKGVKEAHGYSIRAGLISELTVGNAMIDTYAKCGRLDYALRTFENLPGKNMITGNAMISGYMKHGCEEGAEMIFNQMGERDLTTWNLMVQVYSQSNYIDRALSLFCKLQYQEGMRPDAVSIMSVLPVCAHLASLHLLRQCHGYSIRACFDDVCLEGAMLDVYSKCGSINEAYKLFRTSPRKDLVMFTAMIGGYAMNGMGKEALEVFSKMLELEMKPDHVIMMAILSACSHAGLVDEGWAHFNSMEEIHGIKPTMEHYSCMVDLLARAGRLKDAFSFITNMPFEANANVWGTLLGACKKHHEVELGRLVANRLFDVGGGDIGNYVVLSNIYAAGGRWDGVGEVRRLMKMKEFQKSAGCSWIEVERRRHAFVVGDSSHPQRLIIYSMLRTLDRQIREPIMLLNQC
ncbi:tetratricopeptide repeat (TPR)-like superfamily protein [Tasmannia lanceolata]|uniref:tetratricopeptide repeat (TPR)-like superfamily protein n=1 Tax=Tasmannia lanceolata TaxID=3420 RepID=UPI0040634E4F